jgi:hypothetical protein
MIVEISSATKKYSAFADIPADTWFTIPEHPGVVFCKIRYSEDVVLQVDMEDGSTQAIPAEDFDEKEFVEINLTRMSFNY